MMGSLNKKTLYASTGYADVVVLPYGAGRFKGVVMLPNEEGEAKMVRRRPCSDAGVCIRGWIVGRREDQRVRRRDR